MKICKQFFVRVDAVNFVQGQGLRFKNAYNIAKNYLQEYSLFLYKDF